MQNKNPNDKNSINKDTEPERAVPENAASYAAPETPQGGTGGGGGTSGAPASARLPHRAKVVDKDGNKIGKVRRKVWYDIDGNEVGEFRREEDDSVSLYRAEARTAYLDKNDNVLSLSGAYMATLRRFRWAVLLIAILLLALITALSAFLSVYFIDRSSEPEIATLFVTNDVDGVDWEDTENLPVFYNDMFGTEKIAPGMTGSYAFRVRNECAFAVEFDLEFDCVNEYGIDLAYTLRRDGILLAGGDEKVAPEGLNAYDMTIEPLSDSIFVLDWEWRHNDAVDTVAGENGAFYTLNIHFNAIARYES